MESEGKCLNILWIVRHFDCMLCHAIQNLRHSTIATFTHLHVHGPDLAEVGLGKVEMVKPYFRYLRERGSVRIAKSRNEA